MNDFNLEKDSVVIIIGVIFLCALTSIFFIVNAGPIYDYVLGSAPINPQSVSYPDNFARNTTEPERIINNIKDGCDGWEDCEYYYNKVYVTVGPTPTEVNIKAVVTNVTLRNGITLVTFLMDNGKTCDKLVESDDIEYTTIGNMVELNECH